MSYDDTDEAQLDLFKENMVELLALKLIKERGGMIQLKLPEAGLEFMGYSIKCNLKDGLLTFYLVQPEDAK